MLGLSLKQLLRYVLEINEQQGLTDDISAQEYQQRPGAFLIPAHVWTPWFGLFGSKSGFNSVAEAFEELAPHIRAIETGLSSDPTMNWRLSENDRLALVSFSDAHSAPNLMREATVIEVQDLHYAAIAQALQRPEMGKVGENRIVETIEFFPEEGKYHYDGIADQNLSLSPAERKELEQSNPLLAKKVTVGVMSRIDQLADRPDGYTAKNRPPYRSAIPLQEIIADIWQVGKQSKKVQREYERILQQHTEFDVLLSLSAKELEAATDSNIAAGIINVREGKVHIEPGYDGVYGVIRLN
jgi:uncharacterized protein (TIGR00375 family)